MRIAVELDSPAGNAAGDSLAFLSGGARTLALAGADCITMVDSPRALARGDSVALAALVRVITGISVIPHITCRDRNLIGLRSALLALDMAGIHDVLVVTGDPTREEARGRVTQCASLHSAELARVIGEWNLDPSIFSKPFTVSAALNVNALDFAAELRRAEKKAANGVTRFFTQPVLSSNALRNVGLAWRELGQELYAGILPVVSEKNAAFLAGGVRGICVGDEVMTRYRGVDKERAEGLALEISLDFARAMRNDVEGLYIITPFRRVDLVNELVKTLRDAERDRAYDGLVKVS